MQTRLQKTALVCFLIGFAPMALADSRDALWKEVEEAVKKGLPKTAIEKLTPIIESSLQDGAHAEAIKAIGRRIALEGDIQGGKAEEKVIRMQAEIAKAPDAMKPVMQAILANWYWSYFQQNRWRFLQRSQTAAPPGDDFTTWDLPRILAETDQQFQKALAAADELKVVPVEDYDALLEKGNVTDAFRPTLYDFLAYNALEFYSAAEQGGARAQDAFDLTADSPIFAPVADFISWNPESTDDSSPTLNAIRIYQELLRFHANDSDPSARLDADLSRIVFGYNSAFGEEKSARYQAALKRFADRYADQPISARALHRLATSIDEQGKRVEARRIAQQGLDRFEDSVGGKRCFNLIQQIESRNLAVSTERVWNDPVSRIKVEYRNVTQVHFRIIPFDFDQFISMKRRQPEDLGRESQKALLKIPGIKQWSAELPATDDYQMRQESLSAPDDLPPGGYYLISSHNEQFNETDNLITFTQFWVSDLALVIRTRSGSGTFAGFVLNALTGEPIAKATVRGWTLDNRRTPMALKSTRTDRNGLFRFDVPQRGSILVHASHGGHELSNASYQYLYQSDTSPKPFERTVFFTDRALYRPGQTIQYKGICLAADQLKNDYSTIGGRAVTIVFTDVNGKEIERVEHQTNDYGSFSGSVTAPRNRLMGRMMLRVDGGPSGQAQVIVEEYKRPKFQVSLEAPESAPRLNDTVNLQGKATAYTGAAIDGATVRWRVVRQVRYPVWWFYRCWWMPPQPGANQEIAHGTTTTEPTGSFDVSFPARPDISVPEESEPTFVYTVHADVVDSTGETRSASRGIRVGYTSISASVSADDWQTVNEPVEITVRTATLDGIGQATEGVLKIHSLKAPRRVTRAPLSSGYFPRYGEQRIGGTNPPEPDLSEPNSWPLDKVVFESGISTDGGGNARISADLKAGFFRATFEAKDRFGKKVTAELPIRVLNPEARKLALKIPNLVASPDTVLEPGKEFEAVWGSGYGSARAFVEIEHRGKALQSYWTDPGVTQVAIRQTIDESLRGGFMFRVTMVRENRAYLHSQRVDVPWTNKELLVKWEHFVSRLEPAQKETWTLVLEQVRSQGERPDDDETSTDTRQSIKAVAEMVATLYDASLDAFQPHRWSNGFGVFYRDVNRLRSQFENQRKSLRYLHSSWQIVQRDGSLRYRSFPDAIIGGVIRNRLGRFRGGRMLGDAAPAAAAADMEGAGFGNAESAVERQSKAAGDAVAAAENAPDLDNVTARANLDETAFFFPHLIAGNDGTVKLQFTMPEALTEWKFLGFAHDRELRGGLLMDTTVTAKELMVQPNPPRFLREGDQVEFTVKVSNQSPTRQSGTVRLTFADARTGNSVDGRLGNADRDQTFDIAAGASQSLSWSLRVPDDIGILTYKAVGSTGRLSDGEEGFLPVLSRRILVTESVALPVRDRQTKQVDFTKLMESGRSRTLEHQSLTVQMVSNPSWFAVMALPYLMEHPHECSEQTFNRLYANSLARHIAASDPKIRRVFNTWKAAGGDTLSSPLEKNQDLKSVMIEETPWLREAEAESTARRNIGILFDDNRLDEETERLLFKLSQDQHEDGAWSWFPGGPPNDYITLYITTGFGRLRHLGVSIDLSTAIKALKRLDQWSNEVYLAITPAQREKNHLSRRIALYLYGRSFFLRDQPIGPSEKEAVEYWLQQARDFWIELGNRQSQAHLAVALRRFGDSKTARQIMASIKERSVSNEELGMFWRDLERSWWWYRAPIETQAMMIEAFDEVMNDSESVEECKVWLLKQKQTQDWKTTKATADAVYALLLRGSDLLGSDELVDVALGGKTVEARNVEAGTGFYERKFRRGEVQPKQGRIRVTKRDDGVAWGSVHWQYLEDISKVTAYEGTPLKLTKQLFRKVYGRKGPVLEPVNGPVQVGDELVVRIVLRTDRDMEYVHLKDHRGSGTEPVNVLSRFRYQDGLGYYESTRDTASHFYMDYLPKGTYVFEYSSRVQLRGVYQSGMASIQCMYAPEFNSHSESLMITVE